MPGIRTTFLPVLASLVLLTACGQEASDEDSSADTAASSTTNPAEDAPTTTSPEDQDNATVSDPARDPSTQPQVAAAMEDLAERQEVQIAEIIVIELIDVTWADGAIGCPKPGMQYSQALVPGQLLTLAAEGTESSSAPETFAYHAGRGGTFRFCADPQPPAMRGEGSGDS